MMRWALVLVLSMLPALFAAPAVAGMSCRDSGHFSLRFGFSVGKPSHEQEMAAYERELRARGYDASNVRMWSGCVQAFVRENGRTVLRLFDPRTLEPVPY